MNAELSPAKARAATTAHPGTRRVSLSRDPGSLFISPQTIGSAFRLPWGAYDAV